MKRSQRIERLARKEERATVTRVVKLSILSVALIAFLFTLGIPLLAKFADLLTMVFDKNDSNNSQIQQIEPPILDDLPAATNSASINVSGFVKEGHEVEIYIDDQSAGKTKVENGKFLQEGLKLKNGENKITAKTISENGQSSNETSALIITFDNTEPELEVSQPFEDQSFSGNNRIKIAGKTEKNAQVYANGFLANVLQDGNFEVIIPLFEGENPLEVKAIDEAGNTKSQTIKVNFKK